MIAEHVARSSSIQRSRPLDLQLLKVFHNEGFYATSKPDFVELGEVADFGTEMLQGFKMLRGWAQRYDWQRSAEQTSEKTFLQCVRVQPALPEVFGPITRDRLSPWSTVGFNPDPVLVEGTRACIRALKAEFDRVTGMPWRGTSVQLPALAPDRWIEPHVDGYLAYQWSEKIHIPLTTTERARNVTFARDLRPHAHHLEVGKVYIINNLEPHAAFNFGSSHRAHLIVDLFPEAKYAQLRATTPKSLYLTDPPGLPALNAAFKAALARRHPDLPAVYRGLA